MVASLFSSQTASESDSVSISWRHHCNELFVFSGYRHHWWPVARTDPVMGATNIQCCGNHRHYMLLHTYLHCCPHSTHHHLCVHAGIYDVYRLRVPNHRKLNYVFNSSSHWRKRQKQCITDPLWREFPGDFWIPLTRRASNAEIFLVVNVIIAPR